jgi:host factor-I protein
MSLDLESGLPSTRLLQTYLQDKRTVEAKLVTGDVVTGTIAWQDPFCVCLNCDGESVLLWRTAIAFVKAAPA